MAAPKQKRPTGSATAMRAMLDGIRESIALLDTQGTIVFANRTAARRLGKTVRELVGQNVLHLLPPSVAGSREGGMWKTIRTGRPVRFQDERSGRLFDNTFYPVFAPDGTLAALAVLALDITREARALCASSPTQNSLTDRRLRALVAELAIAEETARRRIASGLHDEISQTLVVAKLKLQSLLANLASKNTASVCREVLAHLDDVLRSSRSLTFDLVSPVLSELGLAAALEELCERTQRESGVRVLFRGGTNPLGVTSEAEIILFHSVRELLHNAVKHAGARRVKVSVRRVDHTVELIVEDDGKGFPSDSSKGFESSGGFGLFAIRNRVEHLGGRMKTGRAKPRGARITLTVPTRKK